MENQQLVSPSRQCPNTPIGFGQGYLNKEHYDNTGLSSILTWPQLIFTFLPWIELNTEGTALL